MNFIKSLIWGKSIKRQVMRAIKQKLDQAQLEHDRELSLVRKEKNAWLIQFLKDVLQNLKSYKKQYKVARNTIKEKHVNNILSKII